MGNYKKGSDIDIAIIGKDVTKKTIFELDEYLNEVYHLPYFFDILKYDSIANEKLKNHIDTEGLILYSKDSA